ERAHPLDAIVGIAEDGHLAVDILVLHLLDPGEYLSKRLEALDVRLAERTQAFSGLTQEVQQARFALLARGGAALRHVHGERDRGVARDTGRERIPVNLEPRLELVRRVDERRREDRQSAPRRERKRVRAVGRDPYRRMWRLD